MTSFWKPCGTRGQDSMGGGQVTPQATLTFMPSGPPIFDPRPQGKHYAHSQHRQQQQHAHPASWPGQMFSQLTNYFTTQPSVHWVNPQMVIPECPAPPHQYPAPPCPAPDTSGQLWYPAPNGGKDQMLTMMKEMQILNENYDTTKRPDSMYTSRYTPDYLRKPLCNPPSKPLNPNAEEWVPKEYRKTSPILLTSPTSVLTSLGTQYMVKVPHDVLREYSIPPPVVLTSVPTPVPTVPTSVPTSSGTAYIQKVPFDVPPPYISPEECLDFSEITEEEVEEARGRHCATPIGQYGTPDTSSGQYGFPGTVNIQQCHVSVLQRPGNDNDKVPTLNVNTNFGYANDSTVVPENDMDMDSLGQFSQQFSQSQSPMGNDYVTKYDVSNGNECVSQSCVSSDGRRFSQPRENSDTRKTCSRVNNSSPTVPKASSPNDTRRYSPQRQTSDIRSHCSRVNNASPTPHNPSSLNDTRRYSPQRQTSDIRSHCSRVNNASPTPHNPSLPNNTTRFSPARQNRGTERSCSRVNNTSPTVPKPSSPIYARERFSPARQNNGYSKENTSPTPPNPTSLTYTRARFSQPRQNSDTERSYSRVNNASPTVPKPSSPTYARRRFSSPRQNSATERHYSRVNATNPRAARPRSRYSRPNQAHRRPKSPKNNKRSQEYTQNKSGNLFLNPKSAMNFTAQQYYPNKCGHGTPINQSNLSPINSTHTVNGTPMNRYTPEHNHNTSNGTPMTQNCPMNSTQTVNGTPMNRYTPERNQNTSNGTPMTQNCPINSTRTVNGTPMNRYTPERNQNTSNVSPINQNKNITQGSGLVVRIPERLGEVPIFDIVNPGVFLKVPEVIPCQVSALSYAGVVGRASPSPPPPPETAEQKHKGVEQALPKIFQRDPTHPRQDYAPSGQYRRPEFFKRPNRTQRTQSRKFLEALREERTQDSDVVMSASPSMPELSLSPSHLTPPPSPCTNPPLPTSVSPIPTTPEPIPIPTTGPLDNTDTHTRSSSESDTASLDIEFIGHDDVDCAPVEHTPSSKGTIGSLGVRNGFLACILGTGDTDSESDDETDSDWDEITESDAPTGIFDPWGTFNIGLVVVECQLMPPTQCQDTPSSPNIPGDSKLAEVNRKWNRDVARDVQDKTAGKVTFGAEKVHKMVVWGHAYREARRGPWEQQARDRARFDQRVASLEHILAPVLDRGHRRAVYRRLYAPPPKCFL